MHDHGTIVVDGQVLTIVDVQLRDGKVWFVAQHQGPMRPMTDAPATVFGSDGMGICQAWKVTVPEQAAAISPADYVVLHFPMRIEELATR